MIWQIFIPDAKPDTTQRGFKPPPGTEAGTSQLKTAEPPLNNTSVWHVFKAEIRMKSTKKKA